MSTMKIITRTDNFASDAIFVGMYGQLNQAGQFEFDSSLMGLDVAKLTQISIKKGRQSFPESQLHTVDVSDSYTARTLKGVLLSACQQRWGARYDGLIEQQSAGVASTLQSAKEVDDMAADAALEMFGLKVMDAPLERKAIDVAYSYVNARTSPGHDGEWGAENCEARSSSSISAIDRIERITPAVDDQMLQGAAVATGSGSSNFFSGSASMRLVLPALILNDEPLMRRIVDIIVKMPPVLLANLGLVSDCKMTSEPTFSINPVMRVAAEQAPEQLAAPAIAAQQGAIGMAVTQAAEPTAEQTAAAFLQDAEAPESGDDDAAMDAPGVA